MVRYIDADALKLMVQRRMIPTADEVGMVTVENAERYFIKLIEDAPTADVVEIEMLRDWLWEIALNSVGCDFVGDFSIACQDIISRLDGLKRFAEERRTDHDV